MLQAYLLKGLKAKLRFLQKSAESVPLSAISAEILNFCNFFRNCRKGTLSAAFCRNLRFLQKSAENVPISAISAEIAERHTFLQKVYSSAISAEI
jgi:hypothetical protein